MFKFTPCSQCLGKVLAQALIVAGLFFLAAIIIGIFNTNSPLSAPIQAAAIACVVTGGVACTTLLGLLAILVGTALLIALITFLAVFITQMINCNRSCIRGK